MAAPAIDTNALGELSGNWAFLLQRVSQDAGLPLTELWAIPLDGGGARLALRFAKEWGGVPEAIPPEMVVRHLFAPDGRRVVVSGPGDQLVVVELETGRSHALGVRGEKPAWSRDGARIAFSVREPATEPGPVNFRWALASVPASGGPVQRLPGTFAEEWSPDGRYLVTSDAQGIAIVDVASASVRTRIPGSSVGPLGSPFAFWRRTWPPLAVARAERTAAPGEVDQRLDVMDLDGARRSLLRRVGPYEPERFVEPRWNPARNELLYLVEGPDTTTPHVYDLTADRDITLPMAALQATWHPDGEHLVCVTPIERGSEPKATPLPGQRPAVVLARRDGSVERVLATRDRRFLVLIGIATVGY